MHARIKSIEAELKAEITKAKAISESASKAGRGMTGAEDAKIKAHLDRIAELKEAKADIEAADLKADRLRAGVRDLGEWHVAAKSLVEGRQSVELSGLRLFGKSVTDSDLATDEQTGRAVIERPGITPLPLDQRYVFGLFPREDPGGALAVSEFQQSSRALESGSGAGSVLRSGVLDDSAKAELDVEITHVSADMLQVAVLIKDIPNGLFEAEGALAGFLAAEMNKQLSEAIDEHVLDAIAAASPDSDGGGDSFAASIRYALASARAKGISPDALIVTGDQGVELDTTKSIDMPRGYPYGIGTIRESKSATGALLVDSSLAGVLYLGAVRLDRDPYTGFDNNTTSLRAEANVLFVVRNADGFMGVDEPSS